MTIETWVQQEALALEGTAVWRKLLVHRFPDDERSLKAADLLHKLAAKLRELDGTAGSFAYQAFHDRVISGDPWTVGLEDVLNGWAWHRKAVGFSFFPSSAEDYLNRLVESAKQDRALRRPSPQPASV